MKNFIQENCILTGNFALSSGKTSNVYFDLKKALLNTDFLVDLNLYFHTEFKKIIGVETYFHDKITMIGGYGMGGALLVSALLSGCAQSYQPTMRGSIVREPKEYGTQSYVENRLTDDYLHKILVVDDVLTTGRSIEIACDAFLKVGYEIAGIMSIVNRGSLKLRNELKEKYQAPVFSIFDEADFNIKGN